MSQEHNPVKTNFDVKFGVNVTEGELISNVAQNIRRPIPQVMPHAVRNDELLIVGGGWSVEETFDELLELHWQGNYIMALNGAGNYLMSKNVKPSIQTVLDARAVNSVFVETPIPLCKYFLASQCDPSLFDLCEGRDTYIFHTDHADTKAGKIIQTYYNNRASLTTGGSTVGLRAISLAYTLGFRKIHLFGIDSCYKGDKHHSYEQHWNNADPVTTTTVEGREFICSVWQIEQIKDFTQFIAATNFDFALNIHGDGALAHIVATAGTKTPQPT